MELGWAQPLHRPGDVETHSNRQRFWARQSGRRQRRGVEFGEIDTEHGRRYPQIGGLMIIPASERSVTGLQIEGVFDRTKVYPPVVVSSPPEEQASYPTHMTSEQLEQVTRCTSLSMSSSPMLYCPPHRQSYAQT